MSHFTVLVIGDNWEEQLDPFWEIDLSLEDKRKDYRCKFDPKITKDNLQAEYEKFLKKYHNYKEKYIDAKDWVDDWHGYCFDEDTQSYGYYHNINEKWDWYEMGGRWSGFFKLKEGASGKIGKPGVFNNNPRSGYVDQAFKKDIDFEGMIKDSIKIYEETWENSRNEKDIVTLYYKYGIQKDDTKESYIKRGSSISTFAILFEGKWYEKGNMGWWGLVSNEKDENEWDDEFNKLLNNLPDDTLLTLVDCHI